MILHSRGNQHNEDSLLNEEKKNLQIIYLMQIYMQSMCKEFVQFNNKQEIYLKIGRASKQTIFPE